MYKTINSGLLHVKFLGTTLRQMFGRFKDARFQIKKLTQLYLVYMYWDYLITPPLFQKSLSGIF